MILWEAANRICSKRLVPFLPEIVTVLERHGHLTVDATCRAKLLAISPATVDRLLHSIRHPRGLSTTKPGALLKHQIPIRTFSDWDEQQAGFLEADLVAHCGGDVSGSFLCTLVMTDVRTGWTECFALLWRDHNHVLQGIEQATERFPFPILGIDTDNGSEFITYGLLNYCEQAQITFTRCRPYRKNDQCYVEQKNGAIVRQFIGYDRFEGWDSFRILDELYFVLRLYVNFFQPSLKLVEKKRVGGKVQKRYDKAQTPYQRVVATAILSDEKATQLKAIYAALDPVALLRQIRQLQAQLWQRAFLKGDAPQTLPLLTPATAFNEETTAECLTPPSNCDVPNPPVPVQHGDSLELALPQRRTYRRTKPRNGNCNVERWWRTRSDPFADVWDELLQKLEENPSLAAKTLFLELQAQYPWRFTDGQLRTLQRRVQAWRLARIEALRTTTHTQQHVG